MRSRAKAVFPKIVQELLGFSDGDPGKLALERANIIAITDFLAMDDQLVDSLKFDASTDPTAPDIKNLDRQSIRLVKVLKTYLTLLII